MTPTPATPPGVDLIKRQDGTVVPTTTQKPRKHLFGTIVRRPPAVLVTTLGRGGAKAAAGRAGKAAVRSIYVSGQGGVSWGRRAGAALTHGVLREQVRLARLSGDRAAISAAAEQLEEAKDARLQRLVLFPRAALGLAVAAGALLAALLIVLVVLGLVVQLAPGGATWSDWWNGVGSLLEVLGAVIEWLARLAVAAFLPLLAALAWREGKKVSDPPMWLLAPEKRALADAEITPSKVVVALRDLGIPALRKAIKEMDDKGAGMLGPIVLAGRGTQVDVLLPSGVEPNEVRAKRPKLASNLDRHRHELHITLPPAARSVRLWAAHPGALDEPIGPSPLVIDPDLRVNYKSGRAPWGEDLRGDAQGISLYQRHVLVTGLSNQGKTFALRALALWLAHDVKVRFWIADLKGAGDWAIFDGIAERLIQGPTDEHVAAATEMVEDAVIEMERRLLGGGTWDPLICIVDEAQVAFMCPAKDALGRPYGGVKATSRYFMAARKLHNQGRAVDDLLWQGTQDPTDQNLPKLVREGAHIRASLVVGTESQAKMALGDKAVNGGAAPHELRQGLDKGTLVVAGDGVQLPPGEASVTIRTHFINDEAAAAIAARVQERRQRAGRGGLAVVEEARPADHLADVAEVMRDEPKVRTAVILGRLAELDPDEYEDWSHSRLKTLLDEHGVEIGKSDGLKIVRLGDLTRALAARADLEGPAGA